MGTKNYFIKIADFILTLEGNTKYWRSSKKLLRVWYFCFSLIVIGIILWVIMPQLLNSQISPSAAFWSRCSNLGGIAIIIIADLILTFYFFNGILSKDITRPYFNDSILFYLVATVSFGMLYHRIYILWPEYFIYQNPAFIPEQTIKFVGIKGFRVLLDFFIYSAMNLLQVSYFKITARSFVVSIVEIIQRLYGLFFIIFCVNIYQNYSKSLR